MDTNEHKFLNRVDSRCLRHGLCPNCGLGNSLIKGPRGGESRNLLCSGCLMEFNVGPASAQVIAEECPADRLKEVYGIEPRPSAVKERSSP